MHPADRLFAGDDPEGFRSLLLRSTVAGLLRFLGQYSHEAFADIVVGCYDYEPFSSFMPFLAIMIRQDVGAMITKAFEIIDRSRSAPELHLICLNSYPRAQH
jgi:LacI family fructose operon transcriptional repressor